MTARLLWLDDEDHRVVEKLLPWRANGTLSSDEAARVDVHLAHCERCRADLARQVGWRDLAVAAPDPLPGSMPGSLSASLPDPLHGRLPGSLPQVDRAWAAMRSRLPAQVAPASPASTRPARPSGVRHTLWPLAAGLQRLVLVGAASGAACGLAVGLMMVGGAVVRPAPSAEPAAAFHALGAQPAPADADAMVVFDPKASEAQVRAALRASGAHLVGGPTVTDAWLVAWPQGSARVAARLATLRGQPGVLQVASLLGAQTP